ncbi:Golgi-associated olfactory signaling regulator [Hyperolius riggenbachi]|uniref:Golgi-associated olfactory signaling regulator n=1 Tax=Hyperolius riggenbachi TaxID=752182 RepID=UPI0035A35F6F
MGIGASHCIMLIVFLFCYTEITNAMDSVPPPDQNTNATNQSDGYNSSLAALDNSNNFIQKLMPDDKLGTAQSYNGSRTAENDSAEYNEVSNLTSSANLAHVNSGNVTHYIIWKQFINFPNFVVYHTYIGEAGLQKSSGLRKYLTAHKILALFLGMAGVLACLLVIIYCIYIRQDKEDMFSHHRLYGEGFEDPVLHLDTPVDHLDFFSFRETEITPYPTPQHKCLKAETAECKRNYMVEDPKTVVTDDHIHQAVQMGTLKLS